MIKKIKQCDLRSGSFDLADVIDYRKSGEQILREFQQEKIEPVTYFHGHPIIFCKIEICDHAKAKLVGTENRARFSINSDADIIIEDKGLKIISYLIWIYDYFLKMKIDDFLTYFPQLNNSLEFKDRALMSWREICSFESRLFGKETLLIEQQFKISQEKQKGEVLKKTYKDLQDYFDSYHYKIYENSQLFMDQIANVVSPKSKILDLGSADKPWFALGMAERGCKNIFAFDAAEPFAPNFLKQKGVNYICDSIINLDKYEGLYGLDFIYCRGLAPPQKLIDWEDNEFKKFWQNLYAMLNNGGVIYWIQMTNGTGQPDRFFANKSLNYIQNFFSGLGLKVKLSKFGILRILIFKDEINKKIESHFLTPKLDDLRTLNLSDKIRSYSFQLQEIHQKFLDIQATKIVITANPTDAFLIKYLLENCFRYEKITVDVKRHIDSKVHFSSSNFEDHFVLTQSFIDPKKHFLVDGQADHRFLEEYLIGFENFLNAEHERQEIKFNDLSFEFEKLRAEIEFGQIEGVESGQDLRTPGKLTRTVIKVLRFIKRVVTRRNKS